MITAKIRFPMMYPLLWWDNFWSCNELFTEVRNKICVELIRDLMDCLLKRQQGCEKKIAVMSVSGDRSDDAPALNERFFTCCVPR